MDTETKEKLTELQHQQDMLRGRMEADMETMRADNERTVARNESAIDRLQLSNEKAIGGLRTDFEKFRTNIEKALGEFRTSTEKNSRILLLEIAVVIGVGVAVMSLIVSLIVKS